MWAILPACLFALILFLLWVPVDLVIRLDTGGGTTFRVKVVWLYGLFARELKGKGKRVTEKKKGDAGGKPSFRTGYAILKTGIVRPVIRLVKDIFRQVKWRFLEGDIRLGLGDPADTGLLFAAISPAMLFAPARLRQVSVQPDFGDDAVCEGFLHAGLRLRPIRLAAPMARFASSRPVLRLGKVFVLRRWKSKR